MPRDNIRNPRSGIRKKFDFQTSHSGLVSSFVLRVSDLSVGLVLAACLLSPGPLCAIENSDCFVCHSDQTLTMTNAAGKPVSLFIDEEKFSRSIHGKNLCTSCHTDVTDIPHAEHLKPVSCGQCHRVETQIYLNSDHGQAVHKGVTEAASCQDCHGNPHDLLNYRNPASPVYRTNIPETCGRCHGNTAEMEKFHLRQRSPIVSYEKSVHGIALLEKKELNAAVCTDCHGSHDLHKSTNPQSKLYWQNVPNTCGKCHENVEHTYLRSVHGKAVKAGVRDAPVCTDCHGEHTIQAVKLATSRVSPANIPETCGQCHAAQRIVTQYRLPPNVFTTYIQSFHGLALQGGNLTAANCASCHGVHDILPASDPLSTINPKNLPQTCGKCHPGIGTRLSAEFFRVHAPPGAAEGKPFLVNFISWFYIGLITVTIGGMVTFNFLDYLRKARAHVRAVNTDAHAELRLTRLARVQHWLLLVLFILLAYTGFAHKFPDAAWSWPFRAFGETGAYVRGMIHRVCGWSFAGFFVAHLIALFGTRRGRTYLWALWMVPHDLRDATAQFAYNVGLRRSPPPHRRWNYAEKAEYWALIWGSVVMILTGAMLIFTNTVLRLLPKVWHDVAQVIHYYEAVLATLAILVWHFYWVIFDPKEYPMNPSWLIGKKASHTPQTTAATIQDQSATPKE
jgi:cytochrome b subunit of formate dehydrogenase